MNGLFRHPVTRVWIILVAATLLLFALAESADASKTTIAVVIAIAAFKVRMVFLHFMELRTGAMPWRAIAEVWLLAVTGLIIGAYWIAVP